MVRPTAFIEIECSNCMKRYGTFGAADRCCSEVAGDFAGFGSEVADILNRRFDTTSHAVVVANIEQAAAKHGIALDGKEAPK